MCLQTALLTKSFITKQAIDFEILMNVFHMSVPYLLQSKTFTTTFTFPRFCFSWTIIKCLFKCGFAANVFSHLWHLKDLIFSWTLAMWNLSFELEIHFKSHFEHWNGFDFSWTSFLWVFKFDNWEKLDLQMSHVMFFSWRWTLKIWYLK